MNRPHHKNEPCIVVPIGGQCSTTPRHLPRLLIEKGWLVWYLDVIEPCVQLGWKRFMLHNPFGFEDGEDMQWTQRQQGSSTTHNDLDQVYEYQALEFVLRLATEQDIEVIAYLGCVEGYYDDKVRDNILHGVRDNPSRWIDEAVFACQPFIDNGCNLAFDALVRSGPDSPVSAFVKLMQNLGVHCYGEWCDQLGVTQTDWIMTDNNYKRLVGVEVLKSAVKSTRREILLWHTDLRLDSKLKANAQKQIITRRYKQYQQSTPSANMMVPYDMAAKYGITPDDLRIESESGVA